MVGDKRRSALQRLQRCADAGFRVPQLGQGVKGRATVKDKVTRFCTPDQQM
jgi:hypothetical protein